MCKRYLSFDAENELIAKALGGCVESRNAVIMNSNGVIWKIAKRFTGRNKVWNEECYQECVTTLCEKFHLFDLGRGVKWITWATWWIRQACFRYIRHYNHAGIRIPHHMHDTNAHGVGVPFANQARKMLSLSIRPFNENPAKTLADEIVDHRERQAVQSLSIDDDAKWVRSVLFKMRPVHRFILINRAKGKTLQEISTVFSITRERIRQVEVTAKQQFVKLAKKHHPRELALQASC